jgi:hypothetical protein
LASQYRTTGLYLIVFEVIVQLGRSHSYPAKIRTPRIIGLETRAVIGHLPD